MLSIFGKRRIIIAHHAIIFGDVRNDLRDAWIPLLIIRMADTHVSLLQVLPLAHTSGSNRDEVQLVNPQGVNLKAYEGRLETAIVDYTR